MGEVYKRGDAILMNNKDFWEAVKELKPSLFKVFSVIYKLADNDVGYCFATNKGLSDKIGVHFKTISDNLQELKNLGYIHVIEIGKKGNYCEERRIYTNNNFKTYVEDMKNIKNLIVTELRVEDNVYHFYNERNTPKEGIRENADTINQAISTPQVGIRENTDRGIHENTDRGIRENTDGIYSNNTISNFTTEDTIDFSLSLEQETGTRNKKTIKAMSSTRSDEKLFLKATEEREATMEEVAEAVKINVTKKLGYNIELKDTTKNKLIARSILKKYGMWNE